MLTNNRNKKNIEKIKEEIESLKLKYSIEKVNEIKIKLVKLSYITYEIWKKKSKR